MPEMAGFEVSTEGLLVREVIESLSDFFAVIDGVVTSQATFWFRGHARIDWSLMPSALRYKELARRNQALELLDGFKQVAELKIPRRPDDELGWHQLAQHNGLPTRLLDWTENPLAALYFACWRHSADDGLVFMINPVALNGITGVGSRLVLDPERDRRTIENYLNLTGRLSTRGSGSIAVNPVWNSQRILLQRGKFTIHGSSSEGLGHRTPSLAAVGVLREAKEQLRGELGNVGVDEMSLFPELEHACRHLKRRAGLED